MNDWTPGPWKAVPNGGDDLDERALLVGVPDEYGTFTWLADCRSPFMDEIEGNAVANARLIAAAPDLYEALKAAQDKLELFKIHAVDIAPSELAAASESALIEVTAALRKAEGKDNG